MNILVTGANGQLGSEIKEIAKNYKTLNFFFTDLSQLDITNFDFLENFVIINSINSVINCAAYTSVDKAEEEPDIARKVNFEGVRNIIKVLEKINGKLIHISTDYVFDGNKNKPYKESDATNPNTVYGKTKLEGEKIVLNSDIDTLIIRTSWLYSTYGNNFLKTIMKLAIKNKSIKVVSDELGSPTYAADLAKVCLDIFKSESTISKKGKLYHFSNGGVTSWYNFAKAIISFSKINCEVYPVKSINYPSIARRPSYSVLSKENINSHFGIIIPKWEDSLKACIKQFKLRVK